MFTPLEAVCSRRSMRASRDTARGVTDPQSLEARHDLSCAAPAHTEELLDRRAVEVSGCHGPQGGRRFRQVDETRRVGRAWGKLLLYYTLGSDPALWPAGERRERGLITHDKGYYHSLKETPS